MSNEQPQPLGLEVRNVTKRFGSMLALDDVTLEVPRGEVRGIVGQNGSGKSTLMRLLAGYYTCDEGHVTVNGVEGGQDLIAAIHQDLGLSQDMSVAENLGVQVRFGASKLGFINWRSENALSRDQLAEVNVDFDPRTPLSQLSPGDQAGVAIARALRKLRSVSEPGVLLVDESTAYFSDREITVVGGILRKLAADGITILFVSHNLQEVLQVCDSVTVVRNGRVAADFKVGEIDETMLVESMLGRTLDNFYPDVVDVPERAGTPLIEVRELSGGRVRDFAVKLHQGEAVGVTGLVGSGFEQVPYLLVGAASAKKSDISFEGVQRQFNPGSAVNCGISLVPANRALQGLWMDGSAIENYEVGRLDSVRKHGILNRKRAQLLTSEALSAFQVHPHDPRRVMRLFSGGNQQKVLLASRLDRGRTKLLLLHEPTQGVDSGAKREILQIIQSLTQDGVSIMFFSSDYEELANMCQRILIMSTSGSLSTELRGDITEDEVAAACIAAG